jgi:Leucine-rich repeat (LRR) protein
MRSRLRLLPRLNSVIIISRLPPVINQKRSGSLALVGLDADRMPTDWIQGGGVERIYGLWAMARHLPVNRFCLHSSCGSYRDLRDFAKAHIYDWVNIAVEGDIATRAFAEVLGACDPSAVKLQSLKIVKCRESSLPDMPALGSCRHLRSITLSKCSSMDTFPNLGIGSGVAELTLDDCSSLDAWPVLKGWTRLTTANIDFCRHLSNIQSIVACTGLMNVSIVKCPRLTDISALQRLSRLANVRMDNCLRVQDATGLHHCPKLAVVSIQGNSLRSIAPLGLCRKLVDVMLGGGPAIANLAALYPCSQLTSLMVTNCRSRVLLWMTSVRWAGADSFPP